MIYGSIARSGESAIGFADEPYALVTNAERFNQRCGPVARAIIDDYDVQVSIRLSSDRLQRCCDRAFGVIRWNYDANEFL
jgi:hypothetical protein